LLAEGVMDLFDLLDKLSNQLAMIETDDMNDVFVKTTCGNLIGCLASHPGREMSNPE